MDARPIGVFDSGLGGLTALRELAALREYERRQAEAARRSAWRAAFFQELDKL